ncbi:MAG: spore coat associated protein CotJA, partial [Bacillota bacterium]|nr:spore coat associated protein CotJA [Bacillota bacterium]
AGSAGAGGFYDLPGAEPDAGVGPDLPPWPAPEESPGAPAPEPGEGSYGIPAGLDLATAFVPMQSAASYRNQFPYEEALRQGSLWPDLVRPYAGRPWRRPAGGGREWTR